MKKKKKNKKGKKKLLLGTSIVGSTLILSGCGINPSETVMYGPAPNVDKEIMNEVVMEYGVETPNEFEEEKNKPMSPGNIQVVMYGPAPTINNEIIKK